MSKLEVQVTHISTKNKRAHADIQDKWYWELGSVDLVCGMGMFFIKKKSGDFYQHDKTQELKYRGEFFDTKIEALKAGKLALTN